MRTTPIGGAIAVALARIPAATPTRIGSRSQRGHEPKGSGSLINRQKENLTSFWKVNLTQFLQDLSIRDLIAGCLIVAARGV